MATSLALYKLIHRFSGPKSGSVSNPENWAKRPAGKLIWLHAPRSGDVGVVNNLIEQLAEENPDAWYLVTTGQTQISLLSDQCFQQYVPDEANENIDKFLAHWKPDVLGWLSDKLRPNLLFHCSELGIPMYLLDTGNAMGNAEKMSLLSGLNKSTLRLFTEILAGDQTTANALVKVGAKQSQINVMGALDGGTRIPICKESEREEISRHIGTRPVWLAAGITKQEIELIIQAQILLMRRTHRLLLILEPQDVADSDFTAELLARYGIPFARRSIGHHPDENVQVFVADGDDDLGLWYQTAPVTFIGGTLIANSVDSRNPFEPAALGSAIVHGPFIEPNRDAYQRLARAGATRNSHNVKELAESIDILLAPAQAAEFARAAWQVITDSAEVIDHVVKLLSESILPNEVDK